MVVALHETGDPLNLETYLRSRVALNKRSAKIDRVHHLAIVIRHKPDKLFAKVRLNFLQRHIVVLAESIDDDVDLSFWIVETVKHFQCPLSASDSGDVEREHEQNVICKVKAGDSYWIEGMRQVKNDMFVTLAQQIKDL